jgi:hypothetical protein
MTGAPELSPIDESKGIYQQGIPIGTINQLFSGNPRQGLFGKRRPQCSLCHGLQKEAAPKLQFLEQPQNTKKLRRLKIFLDKGKNRYYNFLTNEHLHEHLYRQSLILRRDV